MKEPKPVVTAMKIVMAKPKSKGDIARAALDSSFAYVRDKVKATESSGAVLIFYLPLSPISLNSRLHWSTVSSIKKRYRTYFDVLRGRYSFPEPLSSPWEKATIEAVFHTRATNDTDNLMGRAKVSVDCLVRGGWLKDDSPDCLSWGKVEQVVDATRPAYLVVRLSRDD